MNTDKKINRMDIRLKLSLLWIFLLLNMAYADILSLMDATSPIRKIMAGAPTLSGGAAGRCICDGNIDNYDPSIPGFKEKCKSLGKYHYWYIQYSTHRYRRTWSVLYVFCINRSCEHIADYLVCMEMAEARSKRRFAKKERSTIMTSRKKRRKTGHNVI